MTWVKKCGFERIEKKGPVQKEKRPPGEGERLAQNSYYT